MNKGLVPSEKGLVVGVSVLVGLDYLVSRQIPGLHNTVLFNENANAIKDRESYFAGFCIFFSSDCSFRKMAFIRSDWHHFWPNPTSADPTAAVEKNANG